MESALESSMNTALLFITTFSGVNAVMFQRDTNLLSLPSPFVSARENEIALQTLQNAKDRTACFLQDCCQICYCILNAEDKAALIGPYRSGKHPSAQVVEHMFRLKSQRDDFIHYYKTLPLLTLEQIKLVARTLFTSLYGSQIQSFETEINIQNYMKGQLPPIPDEPDEQDASSSVKNTGMMFYYIEQVRSGNYERAVSTYHKMMRGRAESFYLLGIVEGTSLLRTLTVVALHRARVPDTASTALLNEFKLKIRRVTSLEEARHLSEKMIEQSCALVRSYWSGKYSQSISIAIDYIHRNIASPLSISEIAEIVSLTPNCFSSKFHEEVGVPATAYISKLRLRTAAELLVYTNLSIGDICAHVGMMDSNYFSRTFKKEYKMTPSEYRKLGKAPES